MLEASAADDRRFGGASSAAAAFIWLIGRPLGISAPATVMTTAAASATIPTTSVTLIIFLTQGLDTLSPAMKPGSLAAMGRDTPPSSTVALASAALWQG